MTQKTTHYTTPHFQSLLSSRFSSFFSSVHRCRRARVMLVRVFDVTVCDHAMRGGVEGVHMGADEHG